MGESSVEMKRLIRAHQRVVKIDTERDAAMRERDDALRAAKRAGATYETIKAATGLSNATVVRALDRSKPRS